MAPQLSEGKHVCFVNINELYMRSGGRDFSREHSQQDLSTSFLLSLLKHSPSGGYHHTERILLYAAPKGNVCLNVHREEVIIQQASGLNSGESKCCVISLFRIRFEHSLQNNKQQCKFKDLLSYMEKTCDVHFLKNVKAKWINEINNINCILSIKQAITLN